MVHSKEKSLWKNLWVLFLFLFGSMLVVNAETDAKGNRVTIHVTNASLLQIFNQIEKQTTYHFSYLDNEIDNRADISMSVNNASVSSVASETAAYQPYLLLSNGTAFSAENVKFEKAPENGASTVFAACFESTNERGKLGLNSDFSATKAPVFRTLADGETILPFHAYITSSATSLPVKGAEATNISNIRVSGKAANSVYTLNGSKLSTMPTQSGVYIIGKKKVLVK